ncbi:hypothetical protein ACHAO1_007143 [Botrytis cinerea]
MSNDIPNDWFLVKLTRWENGHETSSALLPVNISAGNTSSGLRNGLEAIYKRIWDYFTVIEKDGNSSDRTNLPSGAALRQSDGIEGLSVDWQGLSAGDWPSQRTLVTEFNLPGITANSTGLPGALQKTRAFQSRTRGMTQTGSVYERGLPKPEPHFCSAFVASKDL